MTYLPYLFEIGMHVTWWSVEAGSIHWSECLGGRTPQDNCSYKPLVHLIGPLSFSHMTSRGVKAFVIALPHWWQYAASHIVSIEPFSC